MHDARVNPDHAATDLSVRQGGFLRRDQAIGFGLTRDQIAQRLKDGRWIRVGRYGYRLIEMTEPVHLLRAAITALPAAVVSHQAAAELHDFARVPRGIPTVSVHTCTTHEFPGVVVRRNHDLRRAHVTEVAGLPATTVPRTIVDLAAVLTRRHLSVVVDEAIAAGLASIDDVWSVLEEVARRGKPGVAGLREVLGATRFGPERGTVLERLGARVLVDGGLPEPQYEFSIPWDRDRRFDAAYPDNRLAIEWDSRRWHLQRDAFNRDRERDREAILHGWRVLRFTWDDLIDRPEHVVATVRAALANRGL